MVGKPTPGPEAGEFADASVTKVLFRPIEAGRKYAMAEHPEERFRQTDQAAARGEDLVTAQVQCEQPDLSTAHVEEHTSDLSSGQVPPLTELSAIHWKIIDLCDMPRRLADILEALGVTTRGCFKKRHLDPLIRSGIVAMTNQEKPRASNQFASKLSALDLGRPGKNVATVQSSRSCKKYLRVSCMKTPSCSCGTIRRSPVRERSHDRTAMERRAVVEV